jgi:hypothetical protein
MCEGSAISGWRNAFSARGGHPSVRWGRCFHSDLEVAKPPREASCDHRGDETTRGVTIGTARTQSASRGRRASRMEFRRRVPTAGDGAACPGRRRGPPHRGGQCRPHSGKRPTRPDAKAARPLSHHEGSAVDVLLHASEQNSQLTDSSSTPLPNQLSMSRLAGGRWLVDRCPAQTARLGSNADVERHGPGGPAGLQNR